MRNFRKMNEICVRMIDRSSERDGIATSCGISVVARNAIARDVVSHHRREHD